MKTSNTSGWLLAVALLATTAIANAQPFPSIEAARDAARTMPKPAVVHLAPGVHRLEKPLVLTPEDSGVTYVADGDVVISGARPVTDWRVEPDGTWSAPVPWVKPDRSGGFRFLCVNGAMRPRARLPKKGYFTIDDKESMYSIGAMMDLLLFLQIKNQLDEFTNNKALLDKLKKSRNKLSFLKYRKIKKILSI